MELFKFLIFSYLLVLNIVANAEKEKHVDKLVEKNIQTTIEQEMERDKVAAQSTIFRVKRLNANNQWVKPQTHKQYLQTKEYELQQQQQQHQEYLPHKMNAVTTTAMKPARAKKLKNLAKNTHGLNKKLLNKLGFTKVKAPNSHNRKRLAVESRRHASPDDSHMFIIKLPPNPHYYSSPQTISNTANTNSATIHADIEEVTSTSAVVAETKEEHLKKANGKKVSFPFSSNGRPGRIYHWNLPIIKKILEDKQRFPNVATATKHRLIDIKDTPTWPKPWENETYEKLYDDHNVGTVNARAGPASSPNMVMMSSYKKSLKRKSPTYYAPKTAVNKNSFNKYFSGNGKPKGFYVIKENQKKPLYYKNIIS